MSAHISVKPDNRQILNVHIYCQDVDEHCCLVWNSHQFYSLLINTLWGVIVGFIKRSRQGEDYIDLYVYHLRIIITSDEVVYKYKFNVLHPLNWHPTTRTWNINLLLQTQQKNYHIPHNFYLRSQNTARCFNGKPVSSKFDNSTKLCDVTACCIVRLHICLQLISDGPINRNAPRYTTVYRVDKLSQSTACRYHAVHAVETECNFEMNFDNMKPAFGSNSRQWLNCQHFNKEQKLCIVFNRLLQLN